jgi:hypothetical protein
MAEDILELRKNHRGGKDSRNQLERDIIISYNKRIKKLQEDAGIDEANRMLYLKSELKRYFGGKQYIDDFIDTFEGTIEEAFSQYPKWLSDQSSK